MSSTDDNRRFFMAVGAITGLNAYLVEAEKFSKTLEGMLGRVSADEMEALAAFVWQVYRNARVLGQHRA